MLPSRSTFFGAPIRCSDDDNAISDFEGSSKARALLILDDDLATHLAPKGMSHESVTYITSKPWQSSRNWSSERAGEMPKPMKVKIFMDQNASEVERQINSGLNDLGSAM